MGPSWAAHPPGSPSASAKTDSLQNRAPSQRARAQAWPLGRRTKNARPAPKEPSAAGEERSLSQPWLCPLPGSRPLAAPSPSPELARAAWLRAGGLWGVRFRRGLRLPGTAEMALRWESWAAFPGPGHPLVQFRSRHRESRLLLGPWEAGDPPPARAQPGAPASSPPWPLPTSGDPRGGGTGSESPGLGCCKCNINSEPQAWIPRRGVASQVLRASASPRGRQRCAGDLPGLAPAPRLPELDLTVRGLVFA